MIGLNAKGRLESHPLLPNGKKSLYAFRCEYFHYAIIFAAHNQ